MQQRFLRVDSRPTTGTAPSGSRDCLFIQTSYRAQYPFSRLSCRPKQSGDKFRHANSGVASNAVGIQIRASAGERKVSRHAKVLEPLVDCLELPGRGTRKP